MASQPYSYEALRKVMPCMEHEYEFTIPNINRFAEGDRVRSDPITVGNFQYRLLIFPFGTKASRGPPTLAGFVEADPLPTIDQERWMFPGVKYSVTLINQIDYRESVFKTDVWSFCKKEVDRGWHSFVSSKELLDPSKGWINNDQEKTVGGVVFGNVG